MDVIYYVLIGIALWIIIVILVKINKSRKEAARSMRTFESKQSISDIMIKKIPISPSKKKKGKVKELGPKPESKKIRLDEAPKPSPASGGFVSGVPMTETISPKVSGIKKEKEEMKFYEMQEKKVTSSDEGELKRDSEKERREEIEEEMGEDSFFESEITDGIMSEDKPYGSDETEFSRRRVSSVSRKTTVYYNKQMNPESINKLSVVLSSEKIYKILKEAVIDATRAATDTVLQIRTEKTSVVDVVPRFPGCVCVPPHIPIDAKLEAAVADFVITPINDGIISNACVQLFHDGKLIDSIPTPVKVVKQTPTLIAGMFTFIIPTFGGLFKDLFASSLFDTIGGIEGLITIISGIMGLITALFYQLKKPKEAEPIESNFKELDKILGNS